MWIPCFVVMKAVEQITQETIRTFAQHAIAPGQTLHIDALAALRVLVEEHHHVAKVTPPELANE